MTSDLRTEQDLATVLAKRAADIPATPWIVTDERSYTYREMDERSNQSRIA